MTSTKITKILMGKELNYLFNSSAISIFFLVNLRHAPKKVEPRDGLGYFVFANLVF